MQTILTIVIVLAAGGYLAWAWAPKRKAVATDGSSASCGACERCSGCSRG